MKIFTELAQANMDHYNDHPRAHTAIAAVMLVGALVGTSVMARRIAKENPTLKSGMYAK